MAPRERLPTLSESPVPSSSEALVAPSSQSGERPRTLSAGTSPEPKSEPEEAEYPPGAFSPDEAIDEQIADLEEWAAANVTLDRRANARFWILRGTAFLASVLAAVGGSLGHPQAVTVLAGVAALFVAVDSAWPGSALRNPYRRAVYDLRAMQNTAKLRWDKVRLAHPRPTSARRVAHALALLDAIQAKRDEVGKYLGDAVASRTRRNG